MKLKPATEKVHALRAKLKALAERGINGEKLAAEAKLKRLEARYDFKSPVLTTQDIFSGTFHAAYSDVAEPLCAFNADDLDIASSVKWAIEQATRVPCLFRDKVLYAQAAPATARRLAGITSTVRQGFTELWRQYHAAGGNIADRNNFILGLYDGMMNEQRIGQPLPSRAPVKLRKAKKKSVGHVAGLNVHPYSVALDLGRSIRFNAPLETLAGELANKLKPALTEAT